jgi:predicted permease
MWNDLRFSLRLLIHSPATTLVAVLTLALGIAANTTVFSWIDGVLLRPFGGASEPEQLAAMEMVRSNAPNGGNLVSLMDYRDYRAGLNSLRGLTLHREDVFTLGDAPETQMVWGELVTGNYFSVLGTKPAVGRTFTQDEDGQAPGAYPVAVISDRVWKSRFGRDPRVIGRKLRVNRRELTVVGVAPPEFRGTMPGMWFDIWIPLTMGKELGILDDSTFTKRWQRNFYGLVRLRPGVSIEQASAEASAFARNLESTYPQTNREVGAVIVPVWRVSTGAADLLLQPLRILMAISVLVLFIACANVANLLLARSVARRKELGIRQALGAGVAQLSRQMIAEALMLSIVAALLGLLMANWMADLLPALVPKIGASVALGFQMSRNVAAFTILVCFVSALISGAAPLLLWLRTDVIESLRQGGRSGNQGAQSHRLRGALVVCEVALATIAVTGAILFVRSFHTARNLDAGFDRDNVLMARFYVPATGLSADRMQQFCRNLRDRLTAKPGIADAAYADYAPLGSNAGPWIAVNVEGYAKAPDEPMGVNLYRVSPGFFNTLRIPLLEGRDFTVADDSKAPRVMIVNQAFVRRYFRGESPIGRKVEVAKGEWNTIVGMVRDSKYFSVSEAPRPHFFTPILQRAVGQQVYYFVRTVRNPVTFMTGMRREVAAVNANAGAFDLMVLREWTEVTLFPQKVAASLLAALGLISLLLACGGLYSVMAYAVTQRTQEIGVRMALGARHGQVLLDVIGKGLKLTIPGIIIGSGCGLLAARLIGSMLVDVKANDPVTFGGSAAFLALVAMLATYIPARRATKVDPMVALRCE